MGIPACLTRYHIPLHSTVSRDHIFNDTGQDMSDMRLAVCGWRAIIKCISRTAFSCFHALLENVIFTPEFFCFFFTFYEIQIRGYFLIHLRFPPVFTLVCMYGIGIGDLVPLPHSKSLLLRISRTNVLLDFSLYARAKSNTHFVRA